MPNPHYIPGPKREDLVEVIENSFTDEQVLTMVKCMDVATMKEFIENMAHFHGVDLPEGALE